MSELLDKQVNAQTEKIFWGSCSYAPASPRKKYAMKMKVELELEKNDAHLKYYS